MRFLLSLFAFPLISAAALGQTTTLYKSTGPDGRVSYSDQPPSNAKDMKTLTFQSAPASPLSAETLAYIAQLKKSADTRSAAPVSQEPVLYSAAWCGYCKKAKAYLASRKVSYREVDIDTDDGALSFARAGGKGGVPFLVVGGKSLSGFSEASYDAIFMVRK
ncbi:glutaredoxin domain-containing protein [Chitinimonas sp.]|uniref:glutaredoxin domain-containing protein n=1 Tax=Chitinimonas sp. TaxID=1934313 RepID=UPI0035AF7C3A